MARRKTIKVFVDTLYWIAITTPNDPWHKPLMKAKAALDTVQLMTRDEVMMAKTLFPVKEYFRRHATETARILMAEVIVIPQTHLIFLRGLDLYEKRPDKKYSLTDCVSMIAMRDEGITEILSNDRHFEQEGSEP
ncbi:MAG: type II toxin-antitoxin system VapC family toxin [Chloracidobacterium sp.]|nr:type II toxin-antitoxin system VapC family toxin [Chloracidobacterium sp.]